VCRVCWGLQVWECKVTSCWHLVQFERRLVKTGCGGGVTKWGHVVCGGHVCSMMQLSCVILLSAGVRWRMKDGTHKHTQTQPSKPGTFWVGT
jgi:hypothetical protein